MLDLVDHSSEGSLVKTKDIALRKKIPIKYLEQIISTLKKGGLVSSVRGSDGGYRLARSPAQITIFEILQTMEGDLSIIAKGDPNWVGKQGQFWQELEDRLCELLNISLSDFAARSDKSDDYMYYI